MQQLADLDAHADRVDVRPSRKRKASSRRKVTVGLVKASAVGLTSQPIDRASARACWLKLLSSIF